MPGTPTGCDRYHTVRLLLQSAKSVTLLPMNELAEQSQPLDDALPLGPQSLVWRYFGDNRMFLIGPRPAVLLKMLSGVCPGGLTHTVFLPSTGARHEAR